MGHAVFQITVVALTLPLLEARADVVATNDAVPYPQLVSPAGTSTNHTVFLFDAYTRSFDLVGQGLDIGTYNPYIALHIVNQSVIRSSRIWFLGGDYPNKVGESGDPTDYPGHQTCLLDNSSMTTGEFRVGSKNSDNTLIVRNGATMAIGKGLFIDMYDGVGGNAVIVTGNGTSMSVTNGALYVGYGNSSNETLSVLQGAHVTVGTPTITQRLRMRFAHDSTVTVSGAGSTLRVTGNLSLGENSTTCYNNRLIVTDGGLLKVDGTFGCAANAAKPPSAVTLTDSGAIALKGTYSSHPLLTGLLAAGGSTAVTFAPGTGDLAGYTVWQAAEDPEPALGTVLLIGKASEAPAEPLAIDRSTGVPPVSHGSDGHGTMGTARCSTTKEWTHRHA